MEEKGLWPIIFIAGMVTAAGIVKAKRHVCPALKNTKVFLAEKREYLEDIFARGKTKRKK